MYTKVKYFILREKCGVGLPKAGGVGVLLLSLLLSSSSAVAAARPTVAINGFKPPLMVLPGGTVSIPLSVSYSFPSNSCVAILIGQPGSRNYTWYNPDYQTARSGQGALSYTATFRAPLLPGMYIYDVVVFYLDGNRWVPGDGKRFAVQVTFIGYIVGQLLKNPVPWLISILALGIIIGILVHRRSILSKLILIPIACLLLLESFAWFFQPIFYSFIYPKETTILWHGLTEKFSLRIGIDYTKAENVLMLLFPITSFLLLATGLGILSWCRIPFSEKIEIKLRDFISGKTICTDKAGYEIKDLTWLIYRFMLMSLLTVIFSVLLREHFWLAMSLLFFYFVWGYALATKMYDVNEVLCAFTKISSSPPHDFVRTWYPRYGDRSDRYEEEVHEPGWVEGSVNLLLWNGKIVTVYSKTLEVEEEGDFNYTKKYARAEVESELERVLSELPPYVHYCNNKRLVFWRFIYIIYLLLFFSTIFLGACALGLFPPEDPTKSWHFFLLSLALFIAYRIYLKKRVRAHSAWLAGEHLWGAHFP